MTASSIFPRAPISRKRSLPGRATLFAVVVVLVVAVSSPCALFVNAFLASTKTTPSITPFVRSTNSLERILSKPSAVASTTTAMFVTSATNIARGGQEQRLSDTEQRALLAQVAEYRRVKTIETDLALKSKTATASSLAAISSSSYYTAGGGGVSGSRIPLLTLARASGYDDNDLDKLQAALTVGQQAREALVTRNMGLVYYCVEAILGKKGNSRYSYVNKQSVLQLQSLTKQDLIQEGAIGLARAVDRWDADIGGKFSTYAVYWIRAAVLRCIAERDDLVRVPEHVSAAIRKMTKAAAVLGLDLERVNVILSAAMAHAASPTTTKNDNWRAAQEAKELAEEAGLTYKQMTEAMKVQQRRKTGILSFESWMQRGKDYETDLSKAKSITETATTMGASSSDSSLEQTEQMKQVFSRYLRPKEMEALSWRYGLVSDHSADTATSSTTSAAAPSKSKKDYLASAEMELYGNIDSQQQQRQLVVKGKAGESMSFDEVGKRMQVSAEYCRRLCRAGLEKLQRAAEDGSLELGLLY